MAEQLADAFVGWREDESLVVSLTGPWGSGKTSIKNFVVDALQPKENSSRADVLEFGPWELSGSGDMEAHFFSRIGAFLGRKDAAKADRKIAQKWAKWTAALRVPEAMVEPLTKHLSSPVLILGLSGILSGAVLERMPWIVAGVALSLLGVAFSVSGTIAERVGQFFTMRAAVAEVSATELKAQLANLLRQRERPLVVVVDDIDRLTSAEVRLVFRLIKANADLPRMLYFVLFERKSIIHALEREGYESGERYLEKIVQASFTVPAIQKLMLNDVLIARLNDLLRELLENEQIDEHRWMDLFFRRLHFYFETLRDVYRFLAALEFHAAVFRRGNSFEVNFVDLFVLETLRMFEPVIYDRLSSQKQLLVRGTVSSMDANTDEAKKLLQDLLLGANQVETARAALSDLFPRASWAWGGHHFAEGFDLQWTVAKRVCTDTHFEKYFYLSLAKGDIAQSELDDVIQKSGQLDVLRTQIRGFKNDGRIERLLQRLRFAELERVPLENAVSFVTAVLDEGDDLPRRTDMWGTDPDMHLVGIVYRFLIRLKSVEERERVAKEALESTKAVFAPARFVSFEEPIDDEGSAEAPDRERIIPIESLSGFRELCVTKISRAAERGELMSHPHMLSLIYLWKEWTNGTAVREWAAQIIADPKGAVAFLAGFVQIVKRSGVGSVVTQQIPRIELKSIETFVSLEALDQALPDSNSVDDDVRPTIKMFRKAMERRRKGLPDRGPLSFRDEEDLDE
jgi:predicted KAP-like P-loop ATPase